MQLCSCVPVDDSQGLQQAEINQNECAVRLGAYDNFIDEVLPKNGFIAPILTHVDYGCIVSA